VKEIRERSRNVVVFEKAQTDLKNARNHIDQLNAEINRLNTQVTVHYTRFPQLRENTKYVDTLGLQVTLTLSLCPRPDVYAGPSFYQNLSKSSILYVLCGMCPLG